jgi:hypothetical protein
MRPEIIDVRLRRELVDFFCPKVSRAAVGSVRLGKTKSEIAF